MTLQDRLGPNAIVSHDVGYTIVQPFGADIWLSSVRIVSIDRIISNKLLEFLFPPTDDGLKGTGRNSRGH